MPVTTSTPPPWPGLHGAERCQEDGRLGLVIRDDGRGFDLDRPRGLGLISLSDRLDTVGGSLTINSGAGLGTSVCVHIPVSLRG